MMGLTGEAAVMTTRIQPEDKIKTETVPGWRYGVVMAVVAVLGFHLSQRMWGGWVLLFLYGVLRLSELGRWRASFYSAVAVGYAAYAPHLMFLWTIFGGAAVVLWGILAVWLGIFVVFVRVVRCRWGRGWMVVLAPWFWLATEYFRSEVYYLRFSWLSAGYAFSEAPRVVAGVGVYGTGFLLMALVAWGAWLPWRKGLAILLAGLALMGGGEWLVDRSIPSAAGRVLKVAGVQLEFPSTREVTVALDEVLRRHPEVQLLVLSEYTFLGPLPDEILAWCKARGRYLVVGAQDPIDGDRYYNTAFVVGPAGEVVFRQVKSVPIQFFRDGEPALTREVWDSPWGRLGIAICYDLSYRRVVDDWVSAGAEGLLVPVMDVAEWGLRQHELHGRVGPIRAAEYGIPIFRLCSSGISQVIDETGRVLATGGYPGAGEIVTGELRLSGGGRLPVDAWLGPCAVWITLVVLAVLMGHGWLKRPAVWTKERTEGVS
jgi:apolipoprotein N-acyltransferase